MFKQETYPADGGDLIDYAADEQDEDARPALSTHIENLENYDTIFIGYPNWWADLPQPLYTFFDEYDFSGKTIIPFNSHNGSRFSNTISTIEELEPDAEVIEDGFTVNERDVPDPAYAGGILGVRAYVPASGRSLEYDDGDGRKSGGKAVCSQDMDPPNHRNCNRRIWYLCFYQPWNRQLHDASECFCIF